MSTPVSVIESHPMNGDADVVVSRNDDGLSGNENDGLVDAEVNYCLIGNEQEQVARKETRGYSNKKQKKLKKGAFFVGDAVSDVEAREKWGWRYELKAKRRKGQGWILNAGEEDEVQLNVECHYLQANVGGCIFNLGDCAHIKGEGKQPHVGRIIEFFKTSDDENYFRVQWFYRAEDTVMKQAAARHDKKRLFFSTIKNDNLLECLLSKVKIIEKAPTLGFQSTSIQPSEYYCDMEYSVKYSTFRSLVPATDSLVVKCSLNMSSLDADNMTKSSTSLGSGGCDMKPELALLDLYAGCGGMSTGLCLGAKLSGVKLATRWAIDYHKSACDSLKLNHPETDVRHTTAEDFLELLKEWEKLCKIYVLGDPDGMLESSSGGTNENGFDESPLLDDDVAPGEFEVSSLVDICYGDPNSTGEDGLKFKVRWKGYGPSDDTWEPVEGLSDCQGHIQEFVRSGYKCKILPCPGDVDVICGGPPCQGISGYNRFRNTDDPLNDERNQQIVVFFDIVKFLSPKYVLMENVADLLRFDKASLGRYAISRLVHMNYQSRLGIMAAGSYGLPQFRLRVFLWGAHPSERLPQFPLPTHEVIVRYFPSAEFEQNTVAYDEGQPRKLQQAIVLRDAISDLPNVTYNEDREEMAYDKPPETEFQKYIRLTKDEFTDYVPKGVTDWRSSVLNDHRPYKISEDDFHRVCHVPHRKGANFRDWPGIVVSADNKVSRDPSKEVLLPSKRPLIPDYVFTFEKGKSRRPFARVWWDENVPTVVTFPNCHNQATLHPEQDRVFTLRECARLQGFPDHYRFCGNIKERYCQVGNAVAVFVSKTLGYSLGMAYRKQSGDEALMTLPPDFAFQVSPFDEFPAQL
uniref:DNA (cytosine-5)-methyltransferase CMT2-like n=1 Tax=Erigeron canadensis TaxID=72917 RepID=UPI001CB96B37|nr:DNA (cytosine-5)-methyltransferase CMT2-like [Erigeron canadensis]